MINRSFFHYFYNMNKAFPVILVAAAGILYFILEGKKFATGLTAKIKGVKFNNKASLYAGYMKIYLDGIISLNNPSQLQGQIQSIKVYAIYKDKIIGELNSFVTTPIQPGGTSDLPVQFYVNTLALVPSIADIIKVIGKGISQSLIIKGSINTNIGEVLINETITFTI